MKFQQLLKAFGPFEYSLVLVGVAVSAFGVKHPHLFFVGLGIDALAVILGLRGARETQGRLTVLGPREITESQAAALKENLKDLSLPNFLMIEYEPGDEESGRYAALVQQAISAGVRHAAVSKTGFGTFGGPRTTPHILYGLTVLVQDKNNAPALAKNLYEALEKSGISVSMGSAKLLNPRGAQFMLSAGRKPVVP